MSQTLRTSLIIDLAGNLQGKAGQFLNSMQKLGTGGSRSMDLLKRSVSSVSTGLDKLGNRYTALLSGGTLAVQIKAVGDLSESLTYLGINAEQNAARIDKLKQKVFSMAQMSDIRVDPREIISGVREIVNVTGDLDLAESQLRNIGLTIRATGSSGQAAGALIAAYAQNLKVSGKDMDKALTLTLQGGKKGSMEMKDFVAQGPRVTAAMAKTQRYGLQAVREMNAVLQVFRRGVGSPEDASTAWKNFFNDLTEQGKQHVLKANHIKLFEIEDPKKGIYKWRSPIAIMDEIIKKSGGDPRKYGQLLGMQTIDGFQAVLGEWGSTGKNPMHDFMKLPDDPKILMADSARAANEFNAAMQNLHTTLLKFSDTQLTVPIRKFTTWLDGLQPGTVERWLAIAKYAVMIGGGLVMANKAAGIFRNLFGGGKSGAGLPGLGGAGGPIPVYVVNKHLSMLPGQGWGFPGGQTPGGGSTGGILTKAGAALGSLGTVMGTGVGAASGAAIAGTVGAGLVIGGSIGYALDRYFIKGRIGEAIYDIVNNKDYGKSTGSAFGADGKLNGTIKITLDQTGQARVTEMKSSAKGVNFDLDSGLYGVLN